MIFFLAAALFFIHLFWGPAGLDWHIVEAVRLPRALGAMAAGIGLALAGLILQTIYRNPLADPYVFGISGAAMLSSLGMYLLWRLFAMPYVGYFLGSLVGAFVVSLALLWLARRATLLVVLLTGVLLAFFTHAAVSITLLFIPPEELGYIYLSLQGSFAAYPPGALGWAVFTAIAAIGVVAFLTARWISVYIHGEEAAAGLGVNVRLVNILAISTASILTGLVVASVGPIGFLGLVAPHVGRWLAGSHRMDLAIAHTVGAGAALALAADLFIKALPRDVPTTPVLSLVGVPVAIYYLWRHVRRV
ncbi:MAG: FecCD family ABC transporter permease [Pyrobaculum sp.]